jgi:hypothetical protein
MILAVGNGCVFTKHMSKLREGCLN